MNSRLVRLINIVAAVAFLAVVYAILNSAHP